jgi:hypothetical protein
MTAREPSSTSCEGGSLKTIIAEAPAMYVAVLIHSLSNSKGEAAATGTQKWPRTTPLLGLGGRWGPKGHGNRIIIIIVASSLRGECSLPFTARVHSVLGPHHTRELPLLLLLYISDVYSRSAPGAFHIYFWNQTHRLRLEKLLYLGLSRSSGGHFKPLLDPSDRPRGLRSKTAVTQPFRN